MKFTMKVCDFSNKQVLERIKAWTKEPRTLDLLNSGNLMAEFSRSMKIHIDPTNVCAVIDGFQINEDSVYAEARTLYYSYGKELEYMLKNGVDLMFAPRILVDRHGEMHIVTLDVLGDRFIADATEEFNKQIKEQ